MPNYPGSEGATTRFVPFPIAIYRGNFLRADEDGTRARLFQNKYFELGFSGGFNFPITSEENKIREGMDNTGALIGFGPAIIFKLYKDEKTKIIAGVGLRKNFEARALDDVKETGFDTGPYLRHLYKPSTESNLTFLSSIEFTLGDQKYNDFFYGVDESEVDANRRSYKAKAGLVSVTTFFGITYDATDKLSLFAGGVYSNLTAAANKNSDLHERQHTYGIGIGATWLFMQSDELVK